jgi:hypothetical protein
MAARGLKDPGVTVAEGRSFYVPALRVARRQRSHRVVGCGPVVVFIEGAGGLDEAALMPRVP